MLVCSGVACSIKNIGLFFWGFGGIMCFLSHFLKAFVCGGHELVSRYYFVETLGCIVSVMHHRFLVVDWLMVSKQINYGQIFQTIVMVYMT